MRSTGHKPARWRIATWLRARRGHPSPVTLSRYLDGDVSSAERADIDAHVRDCEPCRRLLASLSETVRGLRTLRSTHGAGRAERIIAALDRPRLTVVGGPRERVADGGRLLGVRTAIRYCLQRSQLRFTVPIALLVGAVLTLANMGGMLAEGDIDVRTCAICGLDFLLPFVAMNVALVIAMRVVRRR